MRIFAVDPGPEKSAFVYWDSQGEKILQASILPNLEALALFRSLPQDCEAVVIEMIGHYGSGMPAGKEVFNTCVFIGELKEACFPRFQPHMIERRYIKMHLCNSARAKDGNIRQALIDRFGPPGTKKAPGRLYGIKADEWAALALAVFFGEIHGKADSGGADLPAYSQNGARKSDLLPGKGMYPPRGRSVEI
jgi:hypothetical protein